MVALLDNGTNLSGGSISVDFKRLAEIGIGEVDLLGKELLQLVEGGLTFRGPQKLGVFLCETS